MGKLGEEKIEQLKIFHFGVGKGDCTLIMIRAQDDLHKWHTISILIDTGDKSHKAKEAATDMRWNEIWKEIEGNGGSKLDYLVISHFDKDHFGHAARILKIIRETTTYLTDGKVMVLYEEYPWKNELRIVDRISSPSRGYIVKDGNTKGEEKEQFDVYKAEIGNWEGRRITPIPGVDLLDASVTYKLPNFQMLCVAANGYVGNVRCVKEDKNDKNNENDYSLAFVLRFGSFRFYTGGDLCGTRNSDVNSIDGSMEQPLAGYVYEKVFKHHAKESARHVCAALLHHHGSAKSTLGAFLNYFNPRLAVCSADGGKTHPTKKVLQRLKGEVPTGEEKHFPGLLPRERKKRDHCSLLFTFRLTGKKAKKIERIGDSEPPVDDLRWVGLNLEGTSRQDIILHVKNEHLESSNKQPRIYISRRIFLYGSGSEIQPHTPLWLRDKGFFVYDDKNNLVYCDCDRDHEDIPLPTGVQP